MQVKLGHGGTLDPLATGVLIVGVGKGTKSLQEFLECTKEYECVVLFGAATDTYDLSGKIVRRGRKESVERLRREVVEEALGKFRGEIWQRPPVFSALRVDGKRMYEYAREGGKIPEVKARRVEVKSLELIEWIEGGSHGFKLPQEEAPEEEKAAAQKLMDLNGKGSKSENVNRSPENRTLKRKRESLDTDTEPWPSSPKIPKPAPETSEPPSESTTTTANPQAAPHATNQTPLETPPPPAARLRMTVTSGFYVRSLCHDLGAAVGSLGAMASLVRTRQADYALGRNVLEYEELAKGEEVWGPRVKGMLEGWVARRGEGGEGNRDGRRKGDGKKHEEGKGHKGGMGPYERRGREKWRGEGETGGKRRRNSSSDG